MTTVGAPNLGNQVGDTELWLDGGGRERMPDLQWVGVWLDDPAAVDAMYAHIVAQGVESNAEPVDRAFGVRTFSVRDPEGYEWGFMAKISRTDQPAS